MINIRVTTFNSMILKKLYLFKIGPSFDGLTSYQIRLKTLSVLNTMRKKLQARQNYIYKKFDKP